jgi:hypothetical protein
VVERFVVPLKLGNAGGGKGPQFKTDAIRGEGPLAMQAKASTSGDEQFAIVERIGQLGQASGGRGETT